MLCSTVMLLVVREFRRMLKEPSRVAGILLQPLLFLIVFGSGFHRSFRWNESEINYTSFFFPGILGLVVLFSTIYATLSLVEDKKCGLFRLVLVAPSGLPGAIMGKIIATAMLGFGQSLLFLPLIFMLDLSVEVSQWPLIVVLLALGSLSFALIGVWFAWLSPSASAFHALMSVILLPMWLLSGAMFPLEGTFFAGLSFINPMSYLVIGLRSAMLGHDIVLSSLLALLISSIVAGLLLVITLIKKPMSKI